jgi:hypothetical protein
VGFCRQASPRVQNIKKTLLPTPPPKYMHAATPCESWEIYHKYFSFYLFFPFFTIIISTVVTGVW